MQLELLELESLHPGLPAQLASYRAALRAQRFGEALEQLAPCLQTLQRELGGPPTRELCAQREGCQVLHGWLRAMQVRACLLISCGELEAGLAGLQELLAIDRVDRTHSRLLMHVLTPELPEREEDAAPLRRERRRTAPRRQKAGMASARR